MLISLLLKRYKMSWFEGSARVPLIVSYPKRFSPKTVPQNVSATDILPTLVDLAGGAIDDRLPLDGISLLPYLKGENESGRMTGTAYGEYAGEGTVAPLMMIRRGPWKFVTCPVDPPQLYNLDQDPQELCNLAKSQKPDVHGILEAFIAEANERWDFDKIHAEVLRSQRSRRVCWDALTRGRFESWDYQPKDNAREKYVEFSQANDRLMILIVPVLVIYVPMSHWMNWNCVPDIHPSITWAANYLERARKALLEPTVSRSREILLVMSDLFKLRKLLSASD